MKSNYTDNCSASAAEALRVARAHNKTLRANDFSPFCSVEIARVDGTTLKFTSAFAHLWKSYLLIFTEHSGVHVEHLDELLWHNQFHQVPIDVLKGTGELVTCPSCEQEFHLDDADYKYPFCSTFPVPYCPLCKD